MGSHWRGFNRVIHLDFALERSLWLRVGSGSPKGKGGNRAPGEKVISSTGTEIVVTWIELGTKEGKFIKLGLIVEV